MSIENVALESQLHIAASESDELGRKLAPESRKGLPGPRYNCHPCSFHSNVKQHFEKHLGSSKHRKNSVQAEKVEVAAEAGADADSDRDDTLGKRTRCSDAAAPSGSLELILFTVYK